MCGGGAGSTSLNSNVVHHVSPTVSCQLNLTGPEGYIQAPPTSSSASHAASDCSYTVTVYTGYGVEVQVRSEVSVHTFLCSSFGGGGVAGVSGRGFALQVFKVLALLRRAAVSLAL